MSDDKIANAVDRTLSNNFRLNEIEAQDDVCEQLISVSALLLGAYVTIIMNNLDKILIVSAINSARVISLYNAGVPVGYIHSDVYFASIVILAVLLPSSRIISIWSIIALNPANNSELLLDSKMWIAK